MMQALAALAWNGFREARRNRVTVVVAVFAATLVLGAMLITSASVSTLYRVLTDFGLGAMSLMLTLLAIFLSSGLLTREIDRRTIFLVMSKPLSRGLFLVSRLAGNMLTLGVLLLIMALLFCAESVSYGFPIQQPTLVAIGMLWIELLVLTSIAFVFSSFSSTIVSAVVTTGIYFAGHLSADIYKLSTRAKIPFLRVLGKGIYYLLPNLERLNFRPQAAYSIHVAAGEIWKSIGMGLGYAAAMVGLAVMIFSRRDFK